MEWQLANAKNKFSELFNKALSKGAQRVRRRDEAVVVIFEHEYARLTGNQKSFKEHLLNPPEGADTLSIKRDKASFYRLQMGFL